VSIAPRPAVAGEVIRRAGRACAGIALTFDLCPVRSGSGFDEPLIRVLTEHHIHATFFASGTWIASHDLALRELLAVPYFEIGTHGETHASLPPLSLQAQRREIRGPVARLGTTYHLHARLFRPPFGEFTPETVAIAESEGLKFVLWSVVSGDPDPRLPAARIEQVVEEQTRPGSIIIFHANGRGWHTPEIVAGLYQTLLVDRGLSSLTVSELLNGCSGRAIRPIPRAY
jgi:peptidoglycan/xylan/chitin deacetylase (PgdA/CDA1 family)